MRLPELTNCLSAGNVSAGNEVLYGSITAETAASWLVVRSVSAIIELPMPIDSRVAERLAANVKYALPSAPPFAACDPA